MFNFDFKKAAIYQAVKWSKTFKLIGLINRLLLVFLFVLFFSFIYGFLTQTFGQMLLKFLLGSFLITLSFFIVSWFAVLFFEIKLKHPKLKKTINDIFFSSEVFNLAEFLDFECTESVYHSFKFSKSKRIPEINSSVLAYFVLKSNEEINFIFSRVNLNWKEIKEIMKEHLKNIEKSGFSKDYSEDFKRVIWKSFEVAQKKGHERIETGDMITALVEHNSVLREVLIQAKIRPEDIENLTWWIDSFRKRMIKKKRFWEWENLIRMGSLGKNWASGYTITLDKFSFDISEKIKHYGFSEITGYKEELKKIERILSRGEMNNVLLVGQPGVGKNNVVSYLSEMSFLGNLLPEVNHKRFVKLDLSLVAANTESSEELDYVLERIFQEAIEAGNVVLVIEDFHNYIRGISGPGVVDVSGMISRYLHFPQFRIIALTTFSGLHKNIEQNSSIVSLFEKVEVSELSKEETLRILERITFGLEKKYGLFVSYLALRDIVNFADKYIQDAPFPKKAVDLLDEIMVYTVSIREKFVLPKHVAKVISDKTKIPVGETETQEKEKLLDLENLIHKRIINQKMAVSLISSALRRARAEITERKGPMGTFLFLGPTGVGKTETAKALSEIYFGSEIKMIRLDMSEFQSVEDIPRLIGSPGEEGLLTTKVREDPFSLVLLDEFEKAHPNILNLFLQVLDEGRLTDGLGRKVSFKNTIIIATSNAGFSIILDAIKKKTPFEEIENSLLDFIFENKVFRPELVNRFDGLVIFKPLTKKNLIDIAELLLSESKENLIKKDIEFVITPELKERVVDLGYNPNFGAREMKRVIQDNVENALAEALLRGDLKRGDSVGVDPEEFRLIVNSR
jgi:ATP-dependent Clp protease ATP-binding subunit ClpC